MNKFIKNLQRSKLIRSSIALVLAFSVLLSTFAGLSIFAADTNIWSGIADTDFEGSGTKDDPYLITSAEELYGLVTSTEDTSNKYYELTTDIRLNDVSAPGWAAADGVIEWVAPVKVGEEGSPVFKGHFNGAGHVVYGLYVNKTVSDTTSTPDNLLNVAAGLFPIVGDGASITGVGIEGAYIAVKNSFQSTKENATEAAEENTKSQPHGAVGALVGCIDGEGVDISLCYSDDSTVLYGAAAGLVGFSNAATASSVTVVNCYITSTATVNKSQTSGTFVSGNRIGVVGGGISGKNIAFSGCYSATGNVVGTGSALVGNVKNNYCVAWEAGVAVAVKVENMTGSDAQTSMPLLDWTATYRTTSGYPVLQLFQPTTLVPAAYDVWDGTTSAPTKGSGTVADPYLIETPEQFAYMILEAHGGSTYDKGSTYKLVNDIYLNDISAIDWTTGNVKPGYTVNEWTPTYFSGIIYGNGHMVYGMYVDNEPADYIEKYSAGTGAALISENWVNKWIEINDMGMDYVYVDSANTAGVFVANPHTDSSSGNPKIMMNGCYIGSNVTLKGYAAGGFVGGGSGTKATIEVKKSVSLATNMTAKNGKVGGILGDVWTVDNEKIENCYSAVKLYGNNQPGTVTNTYAVTAGSGKDGAADPSTILTADKMQGYDALTASDKMPNLGTSFKAADTYPVPVKLYEAVTGIWGGNVADNSDIAGAGTANDPFIIDTAAKFARMVTNNNNDTENNLNWYNGYYKIVKDIYLNDINAVDWSTGTGINGYTPQNWVSVTATDGCAAKIDGGNHVVYGLYINAPESTKKQALFNYSYNGLTLSNLGIDYGYINAGAESGFFVADNKGNKNSSWTFENCYVGANAYANTTGAATGVGGIVGYANAKTMTFKNCYSLANLTSSGSKLGALAGVVWCSTTDAKAAITFENCYGLGKFWADNDCTVTVTNSYSTVQEAEGLVKLDATMMQGTDALLSETKMAALAACGKFTATETYPILTSFAPLPVEDDVVWDGSKAAPAEGSGTEADPWLIYTAEELAYAVTSTTNSNVNSHYKLMADIYLNDTTKIDWETGASNDADYTIREWAAADFAGTIDGNGKMIYGLYVNKLPALTSGSNSGGIGLISANWYAANVNIKNLGMDYVYLSGRTAAAAFVAGSKPGTINIDRSYVGENVTIKAHSAAGMVAYGNGTVKITNSYSLATRLTAVGGKEGGILGDVWQDGSSASISNSYAVGKLNGNTGITAPVKSYAGVASNSSVTVRTPEMMQGIDVLENKDKMYDLGAAFAWTETYPTLHVFTGTAEPETPSVPDYVWDGTKEPITEGSGTESDPYLINTAEQFAQALGSNGGKNKYYKLTSDIYLNDIYKIDWKTGESLERYYEIRVWAPTFFAGIIDGDGHTVFGMYENNQFTEYGDLSNNTVKAGLITENWHSMDLTIKNLGLNNAYVNGPGATAGFVAFTKQGNITFDRSYIGAEVTLHGYSAGGFIGAGGNATSVKVSNSYAISERITAKTRTAGFLGDIWGSTVRSISNSYAIGNLYGNTDAACSVALSYSTTSGGSVISLDNMKGDDALTNDNKMPFLGLAFYAVADDFPKLCVFDGREEPLPDPVPEYVWDGVTKTQPAEGSGTAMDPYLISNGAELAWALSGKNNGKYYRLTDNIYLNDVDAIDWKTGKILKQGYVPRFWSPASFNGVIEGDAHVIHGLYINSSTNAGAWKYSGVGLIGAVNGNTNIEKLGIDHVYVTGNNAVSVFAGTVSGGKSYSVAESYIGENVTLKGYSIGGFVGIAGGGASVKQSYSLIAPDRMILHAQDENDLSNHPQAGGILGDTWGGNTISQSYAVAKAFPNRGVATSVYGTEKSGDSTTVISLSNMKGLDVLSNAAKMPGLADGNAFYATESYPLLRVFVEGLDYSTSEGEIWSGKSARTLTGSGTEADPYLITNGAELAFAVLKGGFNGAYFKLTNDIYLNKASTYKWADEATNSWYSDTTPFNGHIDGDGYIIYGLWYKDDNAGTSAGLIPVMNSGSIKNLGIRYAYVRGTMYAAGFIGRDVEGHGASITIDQCFVDDTCDIKFTATSATHKQPYGGAGGIIGYAAPRAGLEDGTPALIITNSYSKAVLSAWTGDRANGIIGTSWGSAYKLENCYSFGNEPYIGSNSSTASRLISKFNSDETDDTPGVHVNVYTDAKTPNLLEEWTHITPFDAMCDEQAKTTMSGLDYANIWETVTDTTPKLQIFTSISGKATDMSGDSEVFSSGSGTRNDPYIIKNEAQLRHLIESKSTKNKFYKLGADIYLNDVTKSNWMVNSPSVWYNATSSGEYLFEGTFNGDGHTIYGLLSNYRPKTLEETGNYLGNYTGLFPCINTSATIKNVHVRDSYISGTGYAAAIVGFVVGGSSTSGEYATVMGCSADESVVIKGQTTGGLIGGGTRGLALYYSYFTGTLEATEADKGRQNALVGDIWSSDQKAAECYSVGYTNYRPGYAPALAINVYGTVAQGGTISVAESDMLGSKAKSTMRDFSWDTVWTTASGKTPQLKVIPDDMKLTFTDEGEKGRVWSGKMATKFAGGTGTEEDPYLIETPEQMAYLISIGAKSLGNHYKLVADLKMNDTSYNGWEEHARPWLSGSLQFGGHFDGDGHVVSGLYYNGSASHVALFPQVTGGCVIEKVGVIESTIISNVSDTVTQTYVAGITAYYSGWYTEEYPYPVISQCFVDDTVYLEGFFAGGIACGTPRAYYIDNCYFTGELFGESHNGTMIGNTWASEDYLSVVVDSFSSAVDRNKMSSNNGAARINIEDYYHDGSPGNASATQIGLLFMKGELAKQYMPGLDYVNIWKIVEGGTPVLRCFANAEKYSCTREPAKVEIAFVTGEGNPVDPIYGYPGFTELTEDMLPIPTRYGYDFGGWYYFAECDLPFDLELFPEYDCYLYAKWVERGFSQGFEGKIDESYDFNAGSQLFKPGVSGYNPRYVHAGLRSVKTLGDGVNESIFLLSYDNMLKVGQQYDIKFWLNTTTDGASGTIEFLHANHGQYDSDIVGYEVAYEYNNLKAGQWVECSTTITANAPFLLIRTSADHVLYFDDFQVVDIDKTGELGKLEGFNPDNINAEPQGGLPIVWIIVIIAGGVVLLGAIAAVTVILVKRKKKTAQ